MILKSSCFFFHFVSLIILKLYDQIQEISITKICLYLGSVNIIWFSEFRELFKRIFKRSINNVCISYIFVLSNELIKGVKRFTYAENVTCVHRVLLSLGTIYIKAVKRLNDFWILLYVNTWWQNGTCFFFFIVFKKELVYNWVSFLAFLVSFPNLQFYRYCD